MNAVNIIPPQAWYERDVIPPQAWYEALLIVGANTSVLFLSLVGVAAAAVAYVATLPGGWRVWLIVHSFSYNPMFFYFLYDS